MTQAKFTDQELIEALKAGITSSAALGRKFEVDESTIRSRRAKLVKRGYSPELNLTELVPDGYKISGVSGHYSVKADGSKVLTHQWVKSSEDKARQLEIIESMCKGFVDNLPKIKPTALSDRLWFSKDVMAVYPLGDPHIGMLAWEAESGENWDLKIAEEIFCTAFDRIVKTAPNCDECLILNLGDFFHVDNLEGTTSRSGNHLDKDGRYAKMIQIGVKVIRQMISTALVHHNKVRVINCIGNHDDTGSIFLSIALQHIYENEPRVSIDGSPTAFHYVKFGRVLIGAHHGHTCKMENLPGVMAADKAKDWGDTSFRYWLTGHIHHDSLKEFPGCKVESFRTLAAKDAYATYGGWRSGQDTKCIVYHKEWGETERHTVNIAQVR